MNPTDALSHDDQLDLRWYFTEAHGDCGIRSPFGAQLDIIRTGLVPQKHCHKAHDGVSDRVFYAGQRANGISRKLSRLTPRQRAVLEAQFSCDDHVGECGVTLTLLCMQSFAKRLFAAMCADVARKHRGSEKRKHATTTIRNWVLYLGEQLRRDADCTDGKVLGQLIALSRKELQDACLCYRRAV